MARLRTPDELRKNAPRVTPNVDLFAPQTADQQRQQRFTAGVFNPGITPQSEQREQIIAKASDPAGTGLVGGIDPEKAVAAADWTQTLLDQYDEADAYQRDLLLQDEQAQKAEASRKRIGAIADAISGVANMWGVSKGAYNQANPQSYKLISDNIVRDQNLRRSNIERANRRLDDLAKALQMAGYRQSNLDFKRDELDFKQWREGNLNSSRNAKIEQGNDRIQASIDNNVRNNETRQYVADLNYRGKMASVGATNHKTDTQAETEREKIDAKRAADAVKEVKDSNKKIIANLADDDNIAATRDEIGEALYGPKAGWSAEQMIAVGKIRKKEIEEYANTHHDWAAKKGIKPVPGEDGGVSAQSSQKKRSPGDYKRGGSQSEKDKINSFRRGNKQ